MDWFCDSIFGVVFVLLLVLAAIFGPMIFIANLASSASCSQQAEKMNLPHSYGFIQGCMVQTPQGWIDIDHYIINRPETK